MLTIDTYIIILPSEDPFIQPLFSKFETRTNLSKSLNHFILPPEEAAINWVCSVLSGAPFIYGNYTSVGCVFYCL